MLCAWTRKQEKPRDEDDVETQQRDSRSRLRLWLERCRDPPLLFDYHIFPLSGDSSLA